MAGKNTAVFGIYPSAKHAERAVDSLLAGILTVDRRLHVVGHNAGPTTAGQRGSAQRFVPVAAVEP